MVSVRINLWRGNGSLLSWFRLTLHEWKEYKGIEEQLDSERNRLRMRNEKSATGRAIVSIVFLITSNYQLIYSYSLSSRERESQKEERRKEEKETESKFPEKTENEFFSFDCNGSDWRTKAIHLSQTGLESSLINKGKERKWEGKGDERGRILPIDDEWKAEGLTEQFFCIGNFKKLGSGRREEERMRRRGEKERKGRQR